MANLDDSHLTKYVWRLESFWVDAKGFLEESGYRIHPRFDLTYTPTSPAEKKSALTKMPRPASMVDAVRVKDSTPVVLKQVGEREARIASYFSSLKDPRNHCVRIYEVLRHGSWFLIVMPQLLPCDRPPFDTVGEALECFRQLFEGVQFMHKHRTSHGDLTVANLMMDGNTMYPDGFNPTDPCVWPVLARSHKARRTRAQCWPRYYIIDFECSAYFPDNYDGVGAFTDETDKIRTPGQNPFPNDIHYLGQFLKRDFLNNPEFKRRHFEFLRPLAQDMLHETPSLRPTIDEVVLRFDSILKSTPRSHMRHMIQPEDHWQYDLFFPFRHIYLRVKQTLLLRSPIPKDILPPTTIIPDGQRDFYTKARYGDEEGPDTLQLRIRARFMHYKDG